MPKNLSKSILKKIAKKALGRLENYDLVAIAGALEYYADNEKGRSGVSIPDLDIVDVPMLRGTARATAAALKAYARVRHEEDGETFFVARRRRRSGAATGEPCRKRNSTH